MIVVNTDKSEKVQLVLSGVNIHSETSAAIYILQTDKVFLTLADGTENTLSSGEEFIDIDENNIDAAVFSKEDLTLNGSGRLTVESPAGHGIVSKDSLTITGGTYSVTTASHGMTGKDDVCITGADITIASGKDGIHAENDEDTELGYVYIAGGTFDITAEGDGISASAYLCVLDGSFTLTTGGGSVNGEQQTSDAWGGFGGGKGGMGGHGGMPGGMGGDMGSFGGQGDTAAESEEDSTSIKGIKASGALEIYGGSFTIDSADDAIHGNGDVTIAGGVYQISTGDDGIHGDNALTVSGGTINITESYEGLEGLSVDVTGGSITIVASDDGINAAGGTDQSGMGGFRGNDRFGSSASSDSYICISGGNIFMNASGDGVDSNGSLTISGGNTIVFGPTSGDTSVLDYETTGVITGGTFAGSGAYSMAQSFSDSEQGVIALSVGNQSSGTQVTLTDEAGNVLFDIQPNLDFAIVILSSPDMVKGESYTVTVGAASGTFEAS